MLRVQALRNWQFPLPVSWDVFVMQPPSCEEGSTSLQKGRGSRSSASADLPSLWVSHFRSGSSSPQSSVLDSGNSDGLSLLGTVWIADTWAKSMVFVVWSHHWDLGYFCYTAGIVVLCVSYVEKPFLPWGQKVLPPFLYNTFKAWFAHLVSVIYLQIIFLIVIEYI